MSDRLFRLDLLINYEMFSSRSSVQRSVQEVLVLVRRADLPSQVLQEPTDLLAERARTARVS